jgi:transposase
MPWCNTEAMNQHLREISREVDPGTHAVLILDQAGWHSTPKLTVPDNITLLFLPPKSPELNPVENIWQFMRDNWLSNRVFKSYDDIVALCCEAWNKLLDQPWKISKRWQRPTGFQLDGLKFHGRSSSIQLFGWPSAIASRVALR